MHIFLIFPCKFTRIKNVNLFNTLCASVSLSTTVELMLLRKWYRRKFSSLVLRFYSIPLPKGLIFIYLYNSQRPKSQASFVTRFLCSFRIFEILQIENVFSHSKVKEVKNENLKIVQIHFGMPLLVWRLILFASTDFSQSLVHPSLGVSLLWLVPGSHSHAFPPLHHHYHWSDG